ncbi:MAG: DUF1810 domain-containing protein [Aristaeellaceae bacterium]
MDMSKSLERFIEPQNAAYALALDEIRRGKKTGHWMWFIFPQLRGLGESASAWYYGIEDLREAEAYLAHPVLGPRLREITQATLELDESDALKLFGWPDNLKFRSCMTLFAQVSPDDLFTAVLTKFCAGQPDPRTLALLSPR